MSCHIDRLTLIPSLLLGILVLVSSGIAEETQRAANIVFLMTDDQRWDSFGCFLSDIASEIKQFRCFRGEIVAEVELGTYLTLKRLS